MPSMPGNHYRLAFCSVIAFVLLTPGLVTGAWAQDQSAKPSEKPAAAEAPAAAVTTPSKNSQAQPKSDSDASSTPATTLRLGAGDLVDVNVYNVPELASKARVSDNGDIYLPLIDYVHVLGLTAEEAQEAIEKRLSEGGFVKGPHVTVFVDQYATQNVSLLGEVVKPGIYPILGPQRLFDLLSAAGGLTTSAGRSITINRRDQSAKPITVALGRNLNDNPEANVDIFAGDTIIVRKADVVYVVGDVTRPSGLVIDRGTLTVLQAIALAGGTTHTSKLNGTRIIRKGPEGVTETQVPLKKILEAKVPDVPMNADDILFVPSSTIKAALQSNAQIALQAASLSLVIVR